MMASATRHVWVLALLGLATAKTAKYVDSENPPKIERLHITSDIKFRFATTLISGLITNPKNHTQDTKIDVTLPDEAFISNFTLEIDGKVYPGEVKDKDVAKAEYDKARRRGQSAGHVSQRPRETSRFKVDIAIAANSQVYFNLTYQELLKRVTGTYEHKIYINPGEPVEDFQINVALLESRDITKLAVPPIRDFQDLLTKDKLLAEDNINPLALVTRPTKRSAYITYVPSRDDQSETGLSGQFVVQYDVERSLDGGDVLVVNGYFVHFLAPEVERSIPKDLLFIIDTSGSMHGTKMNQLKEAMYAMLDDLVEGDRFNIITFDGDITLYQPNMTHVTKRDVFDAKLFIKDTEADGWTNINAAILDGIEVLRKSKEEEERSPVILFMTDGQPSSGEQNDVRILQNIQRANEGDIPVFSLAFGKDADWSLVKKMAVQNDGVGRRIYEDSDADLQISGFYDELSVTLLNNVSVKYLGDDVDGDSVTKANFKNYFKGSELVVAGKLTDGGAPTMNLEIFGNSVDGSLVLTMDQGTNIIQSVNDDLMELSDFSQITEKLWAYLTIKQLLSRASAGLNATAIEVMKAHAKELAIQYGFVTSLTSMVVTQPDVLDDRPTTPAPPTTTTTRRPYRYRGGGGGGYGGGGGGDPHYLVRVGNVEHPVCFDVKSAAGENHNLITDPKHGIIITSQIVKSGKLGHDGQPKTFIGAIIVQMKYHTIIVQPEAILYDTKVFSWHEERVKMFGGHELLLLDHGHLLSIRFQFGAEVLIKRHARHQNETGDIDYLNIYVNNEDGFSKYTTGLIGQFVNGQKHLYVKKEFLNDGGNQMAKIQVKEGKKFLSNRAHNLVLKPGRHVIRAKLVERSEVIGKDTNMCWMVHEQFLPALVGVRESWVVDDFINMDGQWKPRDINV